MFTVGPRLQRLVRLPQRRAFTCHTAIRSVQRIAWSREDRDALDQLRARYVEHLPAGKHETKAEAGHRARNEWRWIVESASNDLISRKIETGNVVHHIRDMAARALESDEPLAYILGNQPFGPLSIICRKPTLIPRVETEALVDHIADVVVASLRPSKKDVGTLRILDLCCGTGCIALLLEHKLSEHARRHNAQLKIAAVDSSQAAIELAKENVQVYALASGESMTSVHKADVFDDQSMSKVAQAFGPFDLVVCNPPYIRQEDWASLDNSVRLWEDRGALVGSLPPGHILDGLSFYRRLGQLMKRQGFLSALGSNQPPLVAVEVGHHQAQSVCHIFQEACPNASISVWQDQFGVDRGVLIKIV